MSPACWKSLHLVRYRIGVLVAALIAGHVNPCTANTTDVMDRLATLGLEEVLPCSPVPGASAESLKTIYQSTLAEARKLRLEHRKESLDNYERAWTLACQVLFAESLEKWRAREADTSTNKPARYDFPRPEGESVDWQKDVATAAAFTASELVYRSIN